jgi:hypothetical protein
MANFSKVLSSRLSLLPTLENITDAVWLFLLRFVISAHDNFRDDPAGDHLEPGYYQHNAENEQWPSPDIMAKDLKYQQVNINDYARRQDKQTPFPEKVHGFLEVTLDE